MDRVTVNTESSNISEVLINKGVKISVRDLSFSYEQNQVLKNLSMDFLNNKVTSVIGPSGCGKSTLIRLFNRLNDFIDGTKMKGKVYIDGEDIYQPGIDVVRLRKRVGMIFQTSNPFPKSVYENVAYGLKLDKENRLSKNEIEQKVVTSLMQAALWEEVKDKLHHSALELSGGQQQRLCIARALAINPEILMMDEPASALDPIATGKIEDLIHELKSNYTIIFVTHNLQQASRVSDYTAFIYRGKLIEYDKTPRIFTEPSVKQTEDYITGRFG